MYIRPLVGQGQKAIKKLLFLPSYCHSLTLSTLPHPLLVASQSQSHLSRIYLEPIVTLRDRGLPSSLFPLITHKDRGLPSSLPFTQSHQRPSVVTVAYGQEHLVSALVHSSTTHQGQRPSVVTVPHSLASEAFRRHCCLRPGASCQCSSAFFD